MPPAAVLPPPGANPTLFGHADAVRALEQAIGSGRLPHGWLFHGRPGIGKATLAFRFARALLAAEAAGPGLALDPDHPVFRQVANGAHLDLKVIETARDARTGKAKSLIPVDQVRAATASLQSTAAGVGRRVLIVDGAEQLNRSAANALLKPLEEPPPGAVLILISHRPGQVAPTLRSRCAKLALHGLDDALLLDLLSRYAPDLAADARGAVVSIAKGSLGRALALADGDWLSTYAQVVRTVAAEPVDALDLDRLAATLGKQSAKDGFAAVIDLVQTVFGRLVAIATTGVEPPLFDDELQALTRLAARQPLDCWAALWEKIGRLSAAVDGLNLDHTQALVRILTAMAAPPPVDPPFARTTSSLGDPLLGESHAVG